MSLYYQPANTSAPGGAGRTLAWGLAAALVGPAYGFGTAFFFASFRAFHGFWCFFSAVFLAVWLGQLDGSHTPAKNGGEAVGYQARKKARTITALFLADNRGQPLACASSQAGNHHDSHLLNILFGEICASLEAANIPVAGLFLNADNAFDIKGFC